jgi:hypothetical protein
MQARVGSQHHPLAFRTPRRCLSSAAYTIGGKHIGVGNGGRGSDMSVLQVVGLVGWVGVG